MAGESTGLVTPFEAHAEKLGLPVVSVPWTTGLLATEPATAFARIPAHRTRRRAVRIHRTQRSQLHEVPGIVSC